MDLFLVCFTSGASFLLGFVLFFHPLKQNIKANRWLGFFVFLMACAFLGTYVFITSASPVSGVFFKCLSSLQFLLAPSLYISILFFVMPARLFEKNDCLHFLPFTIYVMAEVVGTPGGESISTVRLFAINENVSFLVRDILPFLTLFYVVRSYIVLVRHRTHLKLITSTIRQVNLDWLRHFLCILLVSVAIWINDALFELPLITEATPFFYAGCVFFLAYFSIKQKAIFAYREKEIEVIADVFEYEDDKARTGSIRQAERRVRRLTDEQIAALSLRLTALMEEDKLFLDNNLDLPGVAGKLGISIHDASFLINETTKSNFYNFVNQYRIEEAKRLLVSSKIEELNILGIAFASGFNSKTTFNTTFKKITGLSPSQFAKHHNK